MHSNKAQTSIFSKTMGKVSLFPTQSIDCSENPGSSYSKGRRLNLKDGNQWVSVSSLPDLNALLSDLLSELYPEIAVCHEPRQMEPWCPYLGLEQVAVTHYPQPKSLKTKKD